MRAWKGIKELPYNDFNSFFLIGGYHGEPFRGAGWGNASFWGGYCNHGNVLFLTWHRAYVWRLENALRSIPGCEDVTLPFWDECSDESRRHGIPWSLTEDTFVLDGERIPNPLKSFVFPRQVVDHISGDAPEYTKPLGYETVRYPLSGLYGEKDKEQTEQHNAEFPDYDRNVRILNCNVTDWLTSCVEVDGVKEENSVIQMYKECLKAPNYTVFSNITSASEWNDNNPLVMSLEQPHNKIHVAIGGFDYPGHHSYSRIRGANGDMGENDTASFDPIFFFHHCFVDRVFWLWQKKHGKTDCLEIIPEYPGTNSVDSQGPTPGVLPNTWLNMESPLDPFRKEDCTRIAPSMWSTSKPNWDIPTVPARWRTNSLLLSRSTLPLSLPLPIPLPLPSIFMASTVRRSGVPSCLL